jgi:tetratricopeptide (TPR) repeat protein
MSDNLPVLKGAVFLSYARQDAEAALRICEALRRNGIEVWFDQSELRGGDAWDQSIRRQIKNCALFVAVISAHTQTRLEGYFRLEWKLAEDRSHLMARGKPFILPVVVDGTLEDEAQVPDAFLSVQWTRLPAGATPAAFGERVRKLLSEPDADPAQRSPKAGPPTPVRDAHRPAGRWLVPTVAGVIACVALGIWQARHVREPLPPPPQVAPTAPESQQLVARAWEQLDKAELGPPELEIADGFCKRATEMDPANADAWAAWSQVDSWYIYHNIDSSKGRQDSARTCASRALELAPSSYEARLAQACYLVRGATVGTGMGEVSTFAPEADRLLRQLLGERRDEPRALFALAILQRNLGHSEEALAGFSRLAANPRYSATAWSERAWVEYQVGNYSAIEMPLSRSLAVQPFWGNLSLKVFVALEWDGDLASARATMDALPATVLQTDFGAWIAWCVFNFERNPEEWLKFSKGVRRDWIQSNGRTGPIAAYNGLAQKMEGHNDAARIEWQTALRLVEQGLAEQPADAGLLQWKGELLTYLGDYSEAERALNQAHELSGKLTDRNRTDLGLRIAEGQGDAAMDILDGLTRITAAALRLDPFYDPLRANPRFRSLLARAQADPERSPQAAKNSGERPSAAGQ